jgi:hypothetical protein
MFCGQEHAANSINFTSEIKQQERKCLQIIINGGAT